MTVSAGFPVAQALVRTLRQASGPVAYIFPAGDYAKPSRAGQRLGGKWLHEAFAPEKTPYPLVTYQQIYGPLAYAWGSVMLRVGFDVKVYSPNSVEANNLFALVAGVLDEAQLPVSGQSVLNCRRVGDLRDYDVDEEGKKLYVVGGTYDVWTDQPLPRSVPGSFTMDAVIAP